MRGTGLVRFSFLNDFCLGGPVLTHDGALLCCLRSTRANQTTKFIDFRQIMNRRPLAVGAETSLNRVYRLWRGMGIRESRASASSQAHEATWRWPQQTNATTWHSPPPRRTLLVAAVCAAGHLPIINSDNEVVGMVTRKDLHKGSDFSKEQFQNEAMGEIISAAL